jgi:hypothetical protein
MLSQEMAELNRDIEERGEQIFVKDIQDRVKNEDPRNYVLIDVDSGDFEVDRDEELAAKRLRVRRPAGRVWMRRVGSRVSRRFGAATRPRLT